MAGASSAKLAAQVSLGGGFGFTAPGYESAETLRDDLTSIRASFPNVGPGKTNPLPIGVGYLGWLLEASPDTASALLDAALDSNVQAVWFAFGNDLGRWIRYVREADAKAATPRKTTIFIQTSSVQEALTAVSEWKADVLVAQGVESGGHGSSSAPSVFSLVSAIIANLPHDGPPVLAAGGLATGSQVAALLTLGAAGAVLGTRFLLTPESRYSDAQKAALIAADSNSTVRTMAFDQARGTLGWPRGINGRALRNKTVDDTEAGVHLQDVKDKFLEAIKNNDPARMVVWAGEGVALMSEVKGAKDIVQELHMDIMQRLRASQALLGEN
ncbi:2-nitropropane dioxygenase [Sparassis latifolia]